MIVNGKDININYRKAEEIQRKMNPINELPENLKVEANKKELKELEDIDSLLYNAAFGFARILSSSGCSGSRTDFCISGFAISCA